MRELSREVLYAGHGPLPNPSCDQLDVVREANVLTVSFKPIRGAQLQRSVPASDHALQDVVRLARTLTQQQLDRVLPELGAVPPPTAEPPPSAPPLVAKPVEETPTQVSGVSLSLAPAARVGLPEGVALGALGELAYEHGLFRAGAAGGYFQNVSGSSVVEIPLLAEAGVGWSTTRLWLGGLLGAGVRLARGLSALYPWTVDPLVQARLLGVVRFTRRLELSASLLVAAAPGSQWPGELGVAVGLRVWVWP